MSEKGKCSICVSLGGLIHVHLIYPRPPGSLRLRCLTGVAVLCAVAVAWSQTRDLRGDLQNLNVRHRTGHYALAGTVSDARLAEYGKYLEYIYRE